MHSPEIIPLDSCRTSSDISRRFTLKASTGLCITFAIGALTAIGSAQAAQQSPEITITGTRVTTIPYDPTVHRPVQEVSVSARVPANLDVLTLNSGVALLEDDVRDAARTACMNADPTANPNSDSTADCVHEAVNNAQPQVDALIARAHREAK
jgi:UrcA family protein